MPCINIVQNDANNMHYYYKPNEMRLIIRNKYWSSLPRRKPTLKTIYTRISGTIPTVISRRGYATR